MRGGAIPVLAWGTLLVVLFVGNWIWDRRRDPAAGGRVRGADHLWRLRCSLTLRGGRRALRGGAPEADGAPEPVPAGLSGAVLAALAVGLDLFGFAFGSFLIYFGAGLLVIAVGRIAVEIRAARSDGRSSGREGSADERLARCSSPTGMPPGRWTSRPPSPWALRARRGASPRSLAAGAHAVVPGRGRLHAGRAAVGDRRLDDRLLSVHMVQHLLLLMVAPLLCSAASRCCSRCARSAGGAPPRAGSHLARAARSQAPALPGRVHRCGPAHPSACVLRRDAAASVLHRREQSLYLVAGLLLWWPILDVDPVPSRRLGGLGRLLLPARRDGADGAGRRLPQPPRVARLRPLRPAGPRAGHLGGRRPAAGRSDHVGGGQHDHGRRRAVGGDGGAGRRGAAPTPKRSQSRAAPGRAIG